MSAKHIQIIVENISDGSFLTINDMVDNKVSEYSRVEVDQNWQKGNHLSWNKKFINGKHFRVITLDEYDSSIPAFYLVNLNHCVDRFNPTWVRFLREDTVKFLKTTNMSIILSQPIEHTYDFISQSHGQNRLSHNFMKLLIRSHGCVWPRCPQHGLSKNAAGPC